MSRGLNPPEFLGGGGGENTKQRNTKHHTLLLFFFNDTATTEIYTLSLHDALPICRRHRRADSCRRARGEECRGIRPHEIAGRVLGNARRGHGGEGGPARAGGR